MILKLMNNLTKREIEFAVNDTKTSKIFFNFSVSLPDDADDGEYTYTLWDGEDKVAEGLCIIGDYVPSRTAYDNKKEYIQYN